MRTSQVLSLAMSVGAALAQVKGFNYGTADGSGAPYTESQFAQLFTTAAGLVGTDGGFNSARLYTMVQAGTANGVVEALPAAASTGTKLLLGLWGSGGDAAFNNEMTALKTAISQFGDSLKSQIVGISVGSEDLYRISPIAAQQGNTLPGAEPSTLVNYIGQVRSAIAGGPWANVPVGHVDTSTAFQNGSNDVVASACDFIGIDNYPYFQNTDANSVSNGASLLQTALNLLTATAKSKSIWITETGWPVSGPTENQGVPSVQNAQAYWDSVGCDLLFGKYNTFWYTLQDYGSSPSFGVVGQTLSTTPLYNLSCAGVSSSSSSSSASASSTSGSASSSGSASASSTSGSMATSASGGSGSGSGSSSTATGAQSTGSSAPIMPGGNNGSSSSSAASGTGSSGASSTSSSGVATYTPGHNAAGKLVVEAGVALAAVAAAVMMI